MTSFSASLETMNAPCRSGLGGIACRGGRRREGVDFVRRGSEVSAASGSHSLADGARSLEQKEIRVRWVFYIVDKQIILASSFDKRNEAVVEVYGRVESNYVCGSKESAKS